MHNYSTIHIHLLTYVYVAPYLRQKFHWIIFCNQWLTWKHVFQTSYSGFLATLSSVSKFRDFDKLKRHLSVQVLIWLESQLKGNPWLFPGLKLETWEVCKKIRGYIVIIHTRDCFGSKVTCIFVPKCRIDLTFNSRVILDFFMLWKWKLQKCPKNLGLNCHQCTSLALGRIRIVY